MFNLEQSIAQWRQQMLAAGISAIALDELESHLRDEFERQVQSGTGDQEAFRRTVLHMGRPGELKAEFAKDGNDRFKMLDRTLGSLWLVLSAYGLVMTSGSIIWHVAHGSHGLALLVGLLLWTSYGAGMLGSILVIRGKKPGRWMVGTMAGLFTLISLFVLIRVIPTVQPIPVIKVAAWMAFYVITAWLVFLPSYSNFKPARID